MKIQMKSIVSSAFILGSMLLSATPSFAVNPSGKAMTWQGYAPVTSDPNVVRVGCYNNCDASNGETALTEKRRILCIVPGDSPAPKDYVAYAQAQRPSDWQFYMGWSGGKLGLTKPVKGSNIGSLANANALCQKQLHDPNARMAEFHDNKAGGWSLGGDVHPNSQDKAALRGANTHRFWVYINDQNANPW